MGNIEGVMDRCKCCLDETDLKDMWSDYCNNGEKEIYGEMLNNCFALSWERQPEMDTEYICDKCIARLRDAYSFKKEILRSDQLLKDKQMEVDSKDIKKEEESDEEIETEYIYEEYLEDECEEIDNSGTTLSQNIKQDKEVLEKEELDKKELDKEVLDKEVLDKEELDKEVLDKEVLDKEVLDKEGLDKEVLDKKVLDKKVLPTERKKKYTEEDVEKCVEAVTTQSLSQTKASLLFNVPRTAISRAIARPSKTTSKVVRTKKHEKRTHADREMAKKIHNQMFPEFENFGKDVSTIFDCSNATPIRCRGGVGYKCCFCPDEFPDAADLKKHTIEQHDSKTKRGLIKGKYLSTILVKLDITCLHCTLCNTEMNNLEQLIDHLINIHGKNIHRNIKNYILPFKFSGEELRCIICHSLFNKFKVLQEHMNTHFRNYICDDCDSGFVTRLILLNHVKCHQIGSFKCDYCSKTYDTHRKKTSHERAIHIHKSMLNKCGYCNEKFDKHKKREDHLVKVHGVKLVTFNCQACEKTFMTQRALRDHTKRDHLMEKHHACAECGKKFYRPCELSKHMVKHTGIKNYKCEVCLKSFLRWNTLREHLRIHANDRRFKCEHCGQTFVQKCSWRGHMRSKHGEGPHETSSKTINTKTQERRKHVDIETVRNINRKFPEFVHFAEDVNTVLDCSNATPIRCRGGVGYRCCFCPDEFPDAADLKRHTLDQHDSMTRRGLIKGTYTSAFSVKFDVTFLQCSLCKSDVNGLEQLIDHLINIHDKDIHRNIKNHILPFKFLGDELKCTICHVSFTNFNVLQVHMNTHFRNFICDECDTGFATRTHFKYHLESHKVGSFKCSFCPKTYNINSKRRSHESSVHTQKSKFRKCGYCKEKFVSIEKKEAYLVEVHGVKAVTFPCLACEMTYTNFRSLREHTKRKHLMEKRHACTECDMKFYSAYGLSRHMIKHNGIKKFKCAECLKSYARKSTLREHMRIHANDRRFKCEYCGQAFVQKCSWRLHMRTKHNEIR